MTITATENAFASPSSQNNALVYKLGNITCDFSNNYLDDGEQTHWLMLKEAQILLALVRAYPNPVKPIELHQTIWQNGPLNESLINKVIINLREKLNDLEAEVIRKVPEFGYVLTMVPKAVTQTPVSSFESQQTESYDDIYHQPKTAADFTIVQQVATYFLIPLMMYVAFQVGFFAYEKLTSFNTVGQWVKVSANFTEDEINALKEEYSGTSTLFLDKTREGDIVICNLKKNSQGILCETK